MNDSYITKNINDNGLMHCGVLGMKWGVRRYQNKDGTYTKSGLRCIMRTHLIINR